jgi:uncharacterized protein (DUF1015 family)
MRLKAFRALRPRTELAARVAAVPYDVVSRAEAAALAEGNPDSFLHVGRSDIDLPVNTDPYDPRVYSAARAALERLVARGVLVRDAEPALFLYRQQMGGRTQTGVVGCVHVDDYEHDVIRKHEKTRKDKEDDRTRHVLALNAHAEPVFLTYRPRPEVDRMAAAVAAGPPLYDFTASDGVRHTVWRMPDAGPWRGAARGGEYDWFLAVLFPSRELQILAYNRLVKDLNGLTPAEFRARLATLGRVEATRDPVPRAPGSFCFFLDGGWTRLTLDPASVDRDDPIRSLDVSLLQDRILGPMLAIGDPRTDKRIDFVGGIRGTEELERRVRLGEIALGISMYPTTIDQLLAVADAGEIMPPKSTWFEPKLRSGLFVHELDQVP